MAKKADKVTDDAINFHNVFSEEQETVIDEKIQKTCVSYTSKQHPFKVGTTYLFRTVTMVDIGVVKEITKDYVTVDKCAWIADTGNFNDCLKGPANIKEIYAFPHEVYVNLSSLIDATPWPYELQWAK